MTAGTPLHDRDFSDLSRAMRRQLFLDGPSAFHNCRFDGLDLSDTEIEDITFTKCSFLKTSFRSATIISTRFKNCALAACDFRFARLEDSRFDTCNGTNATFADATASAVTIVGCKMSGAILKGLRTLDLTLDQTIFDSADLTGLNLKNQQVTGADFTNANLSGANLSGAIFTDCTFVGTELRAAKLISTDLRESRLGDLSLHDVMRDMQGAILSPKQAADLLFTCGIIVA